ncbi:MAG: DNA internalization-related competence protein ComEC/Rec2 [Chloroflexi bacterium]|nr:DNA internalization-related competence protein ComEC/Rec2 [Chloroflexota bacterium]MYB83764.1 DNA internalization-related competence protein ComEC/Rec2 [Chloroflexota bacterium]
MPLAWLGLGYALGLFVQSAVSVPFWGAVLAAVALGAGGLRLRLAGLRIGMALLFLTGGLLGLARPLPDLTAPDGLTALHGTETALRAEVTGAPELAGGSLRLSIENVQTPGPDGWTPVSGKALVWADPGPPAVDERRHPYLRHGDEIVVQGFLDAPRNIGPFDYREHLAVRDIRTVVSRAEVISVTPGQDSGASLLHRTRSRLEDVLQRSVPEPVAPVASAVLLGLRAGISPETYADFRKAGLAHLLAVSGLHAGLVLGLSLLVSRALLGRRYGLYLIAPLALLWGYILLAGAPPSAVRAGIMGSAFLLALAVGRMPAAVNALGLSAFLVLLVEPLSLWDRSFQLSFTAMSGVLLLGLTGSAWALERTSALRERLPETAGRALGAAIASLTVSLGAFVGSLPVVAFNFGEVPLLGAPATLVAMLLMPAFLIASAVTAVAGLAVAPLGEALGLVTWLAGTALTELAGLFAAVPGALLTIDGMSATWVWAAYALIACTGAVVSRQRWLPAVSEAIRAAWEGPSHSVERLAVLGIAGVLMGTVWVAALTPDSDLLHLHVLDVGQGDALLIVAPDGATALVDGGPDPRQTGNLVDALLPLEGLRMDVGVMTHGHADHSTGLLGLAREGRFELLLATPSLADEDISWRTELDALGVGVQEGIRGMSLTLGEHVALEVLNPPLPLHSGTSSDLNNNSIALRLTYGEASALLMADLFTEAEYGLLDAGVDLSADVLKVGHHGSATSTSPELLAAVGPVAAAVPVGAENRFGHPSPEVITRLADAVGQEHLFTTADDGCISFASDGERWWASTGCD